MGQREAAVVGAEQGSPFGGVTRGVELGPRARLVAADLRGGREGEGGARVLEGGAREAVAAAIRRAPFPELTIDQVGDDPEPGDSLPADVAAAPSLRAPP